MQRLKPSYAAYQGILENRVADPLWELSWARVTPVKDTFDLLPQDEAGSRPISSATEVGVEYKYDIDSEMSGHFKIGPDPSLETFRLSCWEHLR